VIGFLIFAGYLVAAAVTIRMTFIAMSGDEPSDDIDEYVVSVVTGMFWPLAALFVGGRWLLKRTLFKETKAQKRVRTERERDQERLLTLRALKKDAPDLLSERERQEMRDLENKLNHRHSNRYYY
jgi:hypothetical protein